jgi:hypothetical protein
MPFQSASQPQTTQANHEPPSLTSIRLPELALKEEQEVSEEFPVVPQTPQSHYSFNASQEDQQSHVSLKSIQLPGLALEEEQKCGLKFPVVPQTSKSSISFDASYRPLMVGSLKSNHFLWLALKETPHCSYVIPTRPERSSIRPSKTKSMRGHAIRSSRGYVKANWILLLLILSILSVVQALTDCQIMKDWLPDMFDGTGTACCSQPGITCENVNWGRITGMYVSCINPLLVNFPLKDSQARFHRR